MTATTQKVRLKFRCDQDFDKMSIGANGKPFCEMCQKSLVDFRTKSLTEVASYTQEKSGCGVFKTEHVETDVVYQLSFASFRKYFLAIGTFISTERLFADPIKDSLRVEDTITRKSNNFPEIETKKIENTIVNKEHNIKREKKPKFTRKTQKYKYGLFLWRRFPFIRFRYKIYYDLGGVW